MAAALFSAWIYARRELPIAGRRGLATLRGLVLVGVLLLLWNPEVPRWTAGGDRVPWVLVDVSPSMSARGADGVTAWERAREAVERLDGGDARVVPFGGDPARAFTDSTGPTAAGHSRLRSTLDRAVESGASEIHVVTDLRLEDGPELRRRLAGIRTPVRFEDVGSPVRNRGVSRFDLPGALEAGDSVRVSVSIFAEGDPDSLNVRFLQEDRTVGIRTIAAPPEGRESVLQVTLPAPEVDGPVRFSVGLEGDDAFRGDDARSGLTEVDPDAGGLVLVSLAADWEPRFLLPVLEQVTGLVPHGLIALEPGTFLRLSGRTAPGGVVSEEDARDRVVGAALLVVHGARAGLPLWLADAIGEASRLILFADDPGGLDPLRIPSGPSRGGEWYVTSDPSPSPLAGALSGLPWSSLPPLSGVLQDRGGHLGDVPLRVQLQGSGPAEPAVVLTTDGHRRRAAVLASGFWRWSFRPGAARDAYRRLWSSIGGWLLANEPVAAGIGVHPVRAVQSAGVPVSWRAAGFGGRSLSVRLTRGDTAAHSTEEVLPDGGGFETEALEPGSYTYEVTDGSDEPLGSGRLLVESYSDDLSLPRLAGFDAPSIGDGEDPRAAPAPGRGLRTLPWPYLILMTLLCAEWTLRRRRGLR